MGHLFHDDVCVRVAARELPMRCGLESLARDTAMLPALVAAHRPNARTNLRVENLRICGGAIIARLQLRAACSRQQNLLGPLVGLERQIPPA